jgi:hypothetical protein
LPPCDTQVREPHGPSAAGPEWESRLHRKGYELIQKLKLNDVEARFATAVNGTESLQAIAKRIGIPLNDALLIVFRFATLEIIDYWSSNVLSLPVGSQADNRRPQYLEGNPRLDGEAATPGQ